MNNKSEYLPRRSIPESILLFLQSRGSRGATSREIYLEIRKIHKGIARGTMTVQLCSLRRRGMVSKMGYVWIFVSFF